VPIRQFQAGRHFHILHAEIEQIDLEHRQVKTSAGIRPYDRLVIALGGYTTMPDLPGLRRYALSFHSPAHALQLRNHLIDAVEAAHQTEDLQERQTWLTFVVGGAGDTGVELAAIIHDYLITGLFKEYPWLANIPMRIIVIGRAARLLPTSKPKTSQRVQRTLEQEGIEVITGTSITGVTETTVETSAGTIPARTLFWAAGITAQDVARQLPVQHAHNGAIHVDNYLRIPEYPDVYVIGDSSWAFDAITHEPVPATAQAARQQGMYVGQTITAEYTKRKVSPYQYKTLGHLALLGHYRGIAEVGPLTLGGPLAWLLWHFVYLLRNPSWTKRIRLVNDWLLSSILGREIGQLRLNDRETQKSRDPIPKV
jgi:NADH dehydrogenase